MKKNIINWKKFNREDPNHWKTLKVKLQEFLHAPGSDEFRAEYDAKVQEFGTSADFPASILPLLKKYQLTDNFDTSYEEIFDMIDISGTRRNGINIETVTDYLMFQKVLEGEKAKVYQMSGTKAPIECDMYGGGLSWSRRLIDDEEYWTLENNAVAFRNKYYSTKAANFYALIDALPATQNLAWQLPEPPALPNTEDTYTANRDIQTINAAAVEILEDNVDSGYGITPENANFIILAPIQLQTRLRMALGLNLQHFSQSPAFVNYNFRLMTTMMLANTDVYYVILPKQKLVGLNRMDLTIYSDFDILSYSDLSVGWGRYGGAIANITQLQRCATA